MEASWAATRKPARAMSRSALPQSKSRNSLNRSIPPGPGCAKITRRGRQSVSRTTSALSYLYLSPRALLLPPETCVCKNNVAPPAREPWGPLRRRQTLPLLRAAHFQCCLSHRIRAWFFWRCKTTLLLVLYDARSAVFFTTLKSAREESYR